jgi:hypothetical protein
MPILGEIIQVTTGIALMDHQPERRKDCACVEMMARCVLCDDMAAGVANWGVESLSFAGGTWDIAARPLAATTGRGTPIGTHWR